jgi:hypothetical protein
MEEINDAFSPLSKNYDGLSVCESDDVNVEKEKK